MQLTTQDGANGFEISLKYILGFFCCGNALVWIADAENLIQLGQPLMLQWPCFMESFQ